LMQPDVGNGETNIHSGIQGRGGSTGQRARGERGAGLAGSLALGIVDLV